MRGRLCPALPSMVGIQQDAWTKFFVICKKPGYAAINTPDVNAHIHLHFEQSHDILDRCTPEPEVLPQFKGIVFGLRFYITGQYQTFRWIVLRALYPEQILKLHFCFGEA